MMKHAELDNWDTERKAQSPEERSLSVQRPSFLKNYRLLTANKQGFFWECKREKKKIMKKYIEIWDQMIMGFWSIICGDTVQQ